MDTLVYPKGDVDSLPTFAESARAQPPVLSGHVYQHGAPGVCSASGHYLCSSGRYGPPESRPHLITRSLHFWIFLFAPSRKTHALDFETKSFSGCIPSSPLSKPLASFFKVQLGGLILQSGRTRGFSSPILLTRRPRKAVSPPCCTATSLPALRSAPSRAPMPPWLALL
jgi:hypothetical protein